MAIAIVRAKLNLLFKPTGPVERRVKMIDLSAPRTITFIASVALALVAVIIHYAHISVPFTRTGFSILLVAYAALAAGNVFRDV